ncbi:hypothetical protein F4814DRAFT_458089 [Daldinia grandis]|nr:hypothetical protein F4814DRAFT_458089 [Daldinia grandis]
MSQEVSESMDQAAGYSAGDEMDTDPNPEGAWVMRRPWHPKLPFDRLQIGGGAQLPAFTKNELKDFVKNLEKETPGQYEEKIDDSSIIKFVARPHVSAIRYAVHATASPSPSTSPRIIMFTDGSIKSRHNVGCGITYKRTYGTDHDWVDAAYGSKGVSDFLDHEAIALHRGLWIAYYEVMYWAGRVLEPPNGRRTMPPKVIIITDGLSGIQRLHYSYCRTKMEFKPHDEGEIHEYLIRPLEKLVKLGSKIEIHWTPGHVGIEGNSRADSLASLGADYAVQYSRSTGLDITDLMLPFSNCRLSQNARGAYPFHLGNPMGDFMHWRKEDTRLAIQNAVNLNYGTVATDFVAWIAKNSISNKIGKATKKVLKKKKVANKGVPKGKMTKRKASGILKKAGKLFQGVFPFKDNRRSSTRQAKRRAYSKADADDLDDLVPHPKRHKVNAGDGDQSCITQ